MMKSLDILKRNEKSKFTYETFKSGLVVVCTKSDDLDLLFEHLSIFVSSHENGISAYDLSKVTGIPVFLALEYLHVCISAMIIVRLDWHIGMYSNRSYSRKGCRKYRNDL